MPIPKYTDPSQVDWSQFTPIEAPDETRARTPELQSLSDAQIVALKGLAEPTHNALARYATPPVKQPSSFPKYTDPSQVDWSQFTPLDDPADSAPVDGQANSVDVSAIRARTPELKSLSDAQVVALKGLAQPTRDALAGRVTPSSKHGTLASDTTATPTDSEPGFREMRGEPASISSVMGGLVEAAKFKQLRSGANLAWHDALFDDDSVQSQVRRQDLLRKAEQARVEQENADPEFQTETGRGLYSGGISTVQQLPGMAASIATGNPAPALALGVANTALPAYPKYLERGASKTEAATGAGLEGALEYVTEKIPALIIVPAKTL